MTDDNPYQAPRAAFAEPTKPEHNVWEHVEPGYWIVILLSPMLIFGGLAIGAWLFQRL
jgi:hypothetical protein